MEADLQRYYSLDYRDRWHPDRRRRLTLRRLAVLLVRHTPLEGEVARAANDGNHIWTVSEHILDDIRVMTQAAVSDPKKGQKPKPHPARIGKARERRKRRDDPERRRHLIDARRRAREHRAAHREED